MQLRARALQRGTLVHRLLQSLPEIALERRLGAALGYLARNADGWSEDERAALARQVVDLTVELENPAKYEEICAEMKAQSQGALKGVLGYTEDKVVATDFRGDARTSIFDAEAGIALDGTFIKVVSWYDNEWGYSNKCLEMARVVAK